MNRQKILPIRTKVYHNLKGLSSVGSETVIMTATLGWGMSVIVRMLLLVRDEVKA